MKCNFQGIISNSRQWHLGYEASFYFLCLLGRWKFIAWKRPSRFSQFMHLRGNEETWVEYLIQSFSDFEHILVQFLSTLWCQLVACQLASRGRSPLFRIGNYDKNCEKFGLSCYCTSDSIHVWTKSSQFMAITCMRRHRHIPGGDKINSGNIIVIFWRGFEFR